MSDSETPPQPVPVDALDVDTERPDPGMVEFTRRLNLIGERATLAAKTGIADPSLQRDSYYDTVRWSDRGDPSLELQVDIEQLHARQPLSRHSWLQEVIDSDTEENRPKQNDVVRAMLGRLQELSNLSQRDMELERATVEMGFRLSSGSDSDGNPFTYIHVRSPEMYSRGMFIDSTASRWGRDWEQSHREIIIETHVVGIGHVYALYKLGQDMGHDGDNQNRWFLVYRAEGIAVDVPLDAITEVVDCSGHGTTVEFKKKAEA